MKYLLYPHGGSGNHGCEAIVRATSIILGKNLMLYSSNVGEDNVYGLDKICLSIKPPISHIKKDYNYLFAQIRRRVFRDKDALDVLAYKGLLSSSKEVSAYLSIGGDNYCYGIPKHIMLINEQLQKRHVPIVLWGCSIEPDSMNGVVHHDLKRFNHIFARESITFNALKERGLNNVSLFPDPAFVLPVDSDYRLPEGFEKDNTVAINISPLVQSFAKEKDGLVLENYVELIKWILRETDMKVALLPHVVWPFNDDRKALSLLSEKFPDEKRILLVKDQNAEQLKGVISRCRFLITARTHASIAAYSTNVPTLVIGYSVKARGIAKDIFGSSENYVKSVQHLENNHEFVDAFRYLIDNELQIKSTLVSLMPEYRKRVMSMKTVLESVIRSTK